MLNDNYLILLAAGAAVVAVKHYGILDRLRMGRADLPEEDDPEEPEEESEETELIESGYYTERGEEPRYSDTVSPFFIHIMKAKTYWQMMEEIDDLKADNAALARKLAVSGNTYYQKDAETWGASYIEAVQGKALSDAEVLRLTRVVEDQNELIERYRKRIRSFEEKADFTRDEATGKILPADGVSQQTKQKKAYWLKINGSSPAEIAEAVGCSVGSVNVYVSRGKKMLEKAWFYIGDDEDHTKLTRIDDLDAEGNSKAFEGYRVIGSSLTEFEEMTA